MLINSDLNFFISLKYSEVYFIIDSTV